MQYPSTSNSFACDSRPHLGASQGSGNPLAELNWRNTSGMIERYSPAVVAKLLDMTALAVIGSCVIGFIRLVGA